jgi:ABC-type Na+ efflux pump permease subunit
VLAVAAAGMLLLTTGCGGSSIAVSEKANRQLRLDVLAVTEAAAAKDAAAAAAALIRLHTHVVAFQQAGDLSSDRAAEIDAAATKVADGLDGLAPAAAQTTPPKPSTSTTTTSSPPSTPKPVEKSKGKGKGHGRG